jgi:hypothetical protein
MGDNEQPSYDKQDEVIMANNIFVRLCELDKQDREMGRDASWSDLKDIAQKLKGFHVHEDVRQLAQDILENEKGFIERDPHTFRVRLTGAGRKNCGTRIDVRSREQG